MIIEKLRDLIILLILFTFGYLINSTFFPKEPDDLLNTPPNYEEADMEVINGVAYALMEDEKYEGVIALTEDYLKKYPEELDLWIHQAVAYYRLGECTKASSSTQNALIRIPEEDETNVAEMIEGLSASIKNDICNKELDTNLRTTEEKKFQENCLQKYIEQKKYLDTETLSEEFTFEKYPTKHSEPEILEGLDLDFSKTARYFRTTIGEQLLEDGVSFDGKYTIAGTAMTGRGSTYWIVDRTNGKAYQIPYTGLSMKYSKDSNLIILNSKPGIIDLFYIEEYNEYNCWSYIEGGRSIMVYDAIPHYFLWEDNKLRHLGPKEYEPLKDLFWENYSI